MNIKASKGYDRAGFKQTAHLMKIFRKLGYRMPESLRNNPPQFQKEQK